MTKKPGSEWTPYGLEHIRQARIRRRRVVAALLMLALLGTWTLLFPQTTDKQIQISVNGKDQNAIEIEAPKPEERPQGVRVSLSPGRVTRMEADAQPSGNSVIQRSSLPSPSREAPIPWLYYMLNLAPWLLIGSAVYLLGKRRGKLDEVNFGVYKGAMPLEMITAASARQVFTKRSTLTSVFGKKRSDYVPPEARAAHEATEDEA